MIAENQRKNNEKSDPNGNRTHVSGVRGQRPRPLDDGAIYSQLENEDGTLAVSRLNYKHTRASATCLRTLTRYTLSELLNYSSKIVLDRP